MKTLKTDLAYIAQFAAENFDDNDAFCYFVEDDTRTDAELDALVEDLAAPIIDAIDCKECANCCLHLDVYVTPDDAQRLSTAIHIPLDEVQTRYIDHVAAQKEWEWGVIKQHPCAFLNGKLCTVYDARPESCRAYPAFTPDFRWQIRHIVAGMGSCPIIFNVIQQLKPRLDW